MKSRRSTSGRLVAAALLVAVVAGCDTGGIYPLLRERDVIDPCASGTTTTWLRTTDEGTEILIVGSLDPVAPTLPDATQCFARTFVEFDSSTHADSGTYMLDAAGNGVFLSNATYDYNFQRVSVFNRTGATLTQHDNPVPHTIALATSGAQLLATVDGEMHVYTSVYDVVATMDPSTQQGAEQLFVLMNLPLYASQVRVVGFGSSRMTSYAGVTVPFQGAIDGRFTVNVESALRPKTNINYIDFEDFTGIRVHGLQETNVNTSGTGPMRGTLAYTLRDGPDPLLDVAMQATIGYDNLRIVDGFADNGYYLVETTVPTVTSHQVDFSFAYDVDFRPTLAVQTP